MWLIKLWKGVQHLISAGAGAQQLAAQRYHLQEQWGGVVQTLPMCHDHGFEVSPCGRGLPGARRLQLPAREAPPL